MEAEICEPALSMKAGWTWSEPRVIGCGASSDLSGWVARYAIPIPGRWFVAVVDGRDTQVRNIRSAKELPSRPKDVILILLGYCLNTAWVLLEYCLDTAWVLLGYCLVTAWNTAWNTAGYQELSSIAIAMAYQGSRNIILNLRETENYNM